MAAVLDRFYATGRRKTSVARVWIRPGSGRMVVNRRAFEDYFPRETLRIFSVGAHRDAPCWKRQSDRH